MPPAPRSASRWRTGCPIFQLTAGAGSTALALSQLFAPGTEFWNVGAALTAPIFDGGALLHQERAARAAYDAVGRSNIAARS